MSKTILVTGGAGFIGSHVSEALLARGDRVVVLDSLDDYYDPSLKRRNLGELRARFGSDDRLDVVEADIRDRDRVRGLCERERIDAVVHLAALPGVRASIGHAHRWFDVNVQGTISVLDACVAGSVPQCVMASTSSVYGNSSRAPFTEDDACDRPLAPYPASKRAAELIGYAHHNLHGLNVTALRFFTVYGPRNRPDMMASMLFDSVTRGDEIPLYEGGELRRDWTFVEDIVQGVVSAVDRPLGFQAVNLGRGEPVLVRDFVTAVERVSGRKANVRNARMPAADVRETCASIDKARKLLGYDPKTSVDAGVERVWEWYQRAVRPG